MVTKAGVTVTGYKNYGGKRYRIYDIIDSSDALKYSEGKHRKLNKLKEKYIIRLELRARAMYAVWIRRR